METRVTSQKTAPPKMFPILALSSIILVSLSFFVLLDRNYAVQKRAPQDGRIRLSAGRFALMSTDISGAGGSWEFRRIYRSRVGPPSVLGHGWRMNYTRALKVQRDGGIEILDDFSGPNKAIRETGGTYRILGRQSGRLIRRPSGLLIENSGRGTTEYSAPDQSGIARMVSLTHQSGRRLSFEYTPQGQIKRVTDWAGRTLDYSYDDRGLLQQLKDHQGRGVRFEYDQARRLTTVFRSNGDRVSYRYWEGPSSDLKTNLLASVTSSRRTRRSTPIQANFDYQFTTAGDPQPSASASLSLDHCGLWEDFDAEGGGVLGADCAGGDCAGLLLGMLHPDMLIWGYEGGGRPSAGCFIVDRKSVV